LNALDEGFVPFGQMNYKYRKFSLAKAEWMTIIGALSKGNPTDYSTGVA
jgi:hypothetical protein